MRFWRGISGCLAALAVAVPGAALAADSTLTLVVGGEGFDGPPRFAVTFDGKPVGEGTIGAAIDTASKGRFADAADKARYVQSFDFKLPEGIFKPDGAVAVKLTNEAHGAVGSKNDRELFVETVAVNGDPLPGRALTMKSSAGVEPTAMLGQYLVVSETAVEGIASAPTGGWPQAKADVASGAEKAAPGKPAEAASPAPVTAAVTAAPAVPKIAPPTLDGEAAASATAAPPSGDKPAETASATATIATPAVPAARSAHDAPAGAAADGIETGAIPPAGKPAPASPKVAMANGSDPADANPDPEANEPPCGISKSFQITGFNENSNDLTPKTHRQLDVVARAIGTQRCVVHLTGYSSTEGDYAHNALFSIERAQNALHYLSAAGVKFRRFSANGVGETTQFGPDPNANRRVVIAVSP